MSRNTKILLGVIGGLAALLIVGIIVASVAIDHSATMRNGKAIEAAQPKQTNDLFCSLYHSLDDDKSVDPVELSRLVLAGKANDTTLGLGMYQLMSGRPPEALEPSYGQFTTLVFKAYRHKPIDPNALMQAAHDLRRAIVRQCPSEHSTTSAPANAGRTVPTTR